MDWQASLMYQFGNVARPAIVDRVIATTASFDDLGPRSIVGTCVHRMDGTLAGTDEYLRTTASRGGATGALTDFGIGGTLERAAGRDGAIFQWNLTSGRRAPWANGRADHLERNGVAFVDHYGIVSVNRDLVSIELSGCSGESACGPETPVSSAQLKSLAALIAYVHDAAGVPYDVFPRHPASGVVTCLEHWEFSSKGCPFPAVRSLREGYLFQAQAIMRAAQLSEPTESANTVPPVGIADASGGPRTPASVGQLRVTPTAGLNLRVGPGLGRPVVTTLVRGTVLTVHGPPEGRDGYIWVPVVVIGTGRYGFVAREYCDVA